LKRYTETEIEKIMRVGFAHLDQKVESIIRRYESEMRADMDARNISEEFALCEELPPMFNDCVRARYMSGLAVNSLFNDYCNLFNDQERARNMSGLAANSIFNNCVKFLIGFR
jgi:hypothetical protein